MRARASGRRTTGGDAQPESASGGLHLGRVLAVNDDQRVLVEYPGCAGPTLARLAVVATRPRLQRAIDLREVAVLAFESGDLFRPLVLALLPQPTDATGASAPAVPVVPPDVLQVDVDGRRVRIEGQDEIVFQCGKASVTLRRNGKVVIRGTHVETFSEGTNRIKGGQVRIN
jgi:Domain of unknown function (DUF6484)